MIDLNLSEVSGVDHPAHLAEGWLMMKAANAANAGDQDLAIEAVLKQANAVGSGLSTDQSADSPTGTTSTILTIAKEANVPLSHGDESDLDPVEIQKALASLPLPLQKMYAATAARALEAETIAKSLQNEKLDAAYLAKARDLDNLPGVTPTEFAKSLRSLDESAPAATVQAIHSVLKAANAALGNFHFREFGTSTRAGALEGTATASLDALAKQFMAEDKSDYPTAVTKASRLHPELAMQHLTDARSAAPAYIPQSGSEA